MNKSVNKCIETNNHKFQVNTKPNLYKIKLYKENKIQAPKAKR